MVPHPAPLHPSPDTTQATLLFDVPVTVALNCSVLPAGSDTLVGVTLMDTFCPMARLADADALGSASLVATTLTLAGEGATAGAVYTADNPLVESVPHAEPLHPAPPTLHVTPVFAVPVTLALIACVLPASTAALLGDTDTNTLAVPEPFPEPAAAKTFSVPAVLVTLPALLVTTTVNSARLIDIVAGGVAYEEEFAPLMVVPFIRHW